MNHHKYGQVRKTNSCLIEKKIARDKSRRVDEYLVGKKKFN
jgi:hypothetical protein